MEVVTLSPKFQVVIPRRVRESMGLHPGEKFQVVSIEERIELIPLRPISEARGILKGFDLTFEREREDRV